MQHLVLFVGCAIAVVSAQWSQFYPEETQRSAAPYQPRGWRPSGPSFSLPLRQQLPKVEYGAPVKEYGVPDEEYGPPAATTTEAVTETTTTEVPTTTTTEETNQQLNEKKSDEQEQKSDVKQEEEEDKQAVTQEASYYIYHPSGLLQKVVFATKDDLRNMAYTAQIKYQNVEPIRGPIYTYDPQTLVFQQLNA